MYELKELSKVKKRPIDFNVTEYYKSLGIVSGPKLHLNFKKQSLVEYLCCIKEEVCSHLKSLLKYRSVFQLQMVPYLPPFNLMIFQLYNGGKTIRIQ